MTNRIPPSLNWLIDKRARVSGEIAKSRKHLEKAQELINELNDLENKLQAIDTTLELHNIQVDVGLITPIRSQELRLNIPYGELTKTILTCIRLHQDKGPVPKTIIEKFVIQKHFDFDAKKVTTSQISLSIHNRLKSLYREGLLERHHYPDKSSEGLWTIAIDADLANRPTRHR